MTATISNYESNQQALLEGRYNDLVDLQGRKIVTYQNTATSIEGINEQEVLNLEATAASMKIAYKNGVAGVTEDMVNTAENNARVAREKFESIGRNIPDGINAGKDQTKGNLFNGIAGMAQDSVNVFRNNSNCYSVGENIATGAAQGVINKKQVFIDSVRQMANQSIFEARKAIDSHSPSRKFRDLVGKTIPEGVAVGIEKNSYVVDNALKTNLTDAYKKLRGVVDVETARTSRNIVSSYNYTTYNNNVTTEVNRGNIADKILVEAVLNVDGKDFTREVVAPNQKELREYYVGR